MPLPPLQDPENLGRRVYGFCVGVPAAAFLFVSLLVFNLLQLFTLLVWPISGQAFRALNRQLAGIWWGLSVWLSERLYGVHVTVSGDPVPMAENAIVIANHQQMPDINFLLVYASTKGRLSDLKWMVKYPMKFVPGAGWGMAMLGCLFLRRDWAKDRASVLRTFAGLVQHRVPMWFMSFPEGTRLTPDKLAKAQVYAQKLGEPVLQHLLVPRTKGFVASVQGLRGHVAAVYDVTIGYPDGVPTLWQYTLGYVRRVHLHVQRFVLSDLPDEEEALTAWLKARFVAKDALLSAYYAHGDFVSAAADVPSAS